MWINEVFEKQKPIIALLHLDALPGDPGYCGNMDEVLDHAYTDLINLQKGGVDGILIANEFSLPYQPKADIATISSMAYVIGKLRSSIVLPFGVNVVKNPIATIDLAAAVGALFARSCFSGAYMGEYGIYTANSGEAIRHRKHLGIEHVKLLFKVNPEADTYLVQRDIRHVAKSIMFGGYADGLCVSGSSAGTEPDLSLLEQVKSVAEDVPVFCNTGCTYENVTEILPICDGALVGTAFKAGGKLHEHVSLERVMEFMDRVNAFRNVI